jgi:hypothetical protein
MHLYVELAATNVAVSKGIMLSHALVKAFSVFINGHPPRSLVSEHNSQRPTSSIVPPHEKSRRNRQHV